jgi:DNA-binding YbaB/EbfC family protein
MQQIIAKAQKFKEKMSAAQKELETKEVTGTSGGGAVTVVMTLRGEVKSVVFDKEIINPDEKDILEDLMVAALRDAKQKADKMYDDGMKTATGGFNIPGLP